MKKKSSVFFDREKIIKKIMGEKLVENRDMSTYELLLKYMVKISIDESISENIRLLAMQMLLKEFKECDKDKF